MLDSAGRSKTSQLISLGQGDLPHLVEADGGGAEQRRPVLVPVDVRPGDALDGTPGGGGRRRRRQGEDGLPECDALP